MENIFIPKGDSKDCDTKDPVNNSNFQILLNALHGNW